MVRLIVMSLPPCDITKNCHMPRLGLVDLRYLMLVSYNRVYETGASWPLCRKIATACLISVSRNYPNYSYEFIVPERYLAWQWSSYSYRLTCFSVSCNVCNSPAIIIPCRPTEIQETLKGDKRIVCMTRCPELWVRSKTACELKVVNHAINSCINWGESLSRGQ